MATPRCPYCNAQGLTHLAVHPTGAFMVVSCAQCGAIHGVVPTVPISQANPPPPPQIEVKPDPPQPPVTPKPPAPVIKTPLDEIGYADISQKIPWNPANIAAKMKATGMAANSMFRRYPDYNGPPHCPTHKEEMKKVTIPAGYPNSGRMIWICPQFKACKQWELAEEAP